MSTKRNESYNRLFTGKVSTATFLTMYTLYILSKGEKMCGKDICNAIVDRFHGSWSPSHGMIYPLLRQMEALGLVKGRWLDKSKKTKRLYGITDEGHKALEAQLLENEQLLKEALGVMATFMSDLYKQNKLTV